MKKWIIYAALLASAAMAAFLGYYTGYVWDRNEVRDQWVQNEVYQEVKKIEKYNESDLYDNVYVEAVHKSIVYKQCHQEFVILKGTLAGEKIIKDVPDLRAEYNGNSLPVYCDLLRYKTKEFKRDYMRPFAMTQERTIDTPAYIGCAAVIPPGGEIILHIDTDGEKFEGEIESLNRMPTVKQMCEYGFHYASSLYVPIMNPQRIKGLQLETEGYNKTAKLKAPSTPGRYRVSYTVFRERDTSYISVRYYFFLDVKEEN